MEIKNLPIEIQEIVFQKQKEQNNTPNNELNLSCDKSQGNFNWDETIEGYDFWSDIYNGYFNNFYKEYPKDADKSVKTPIKFKIGDKVKIINRHPDNTTGNPGVNCCTNVIVYICEYNENYYQLTQNKDSTGIYYGLLQIDENEKISTFIYSNTTFIYSDLELITENEIIITKTDINHQPFKIKNKSSLLDTSIEKVSTITIKLKQKSKTIKF